MEKKDSRIIKAFEFAFIKHQGSKRKESNIPYIVHPVEVAITLMKSDASEDLIIAGFLHDLIEDENVTYDEIQELFGEKVADLVKLVSEPEELKKSHKDPKFTWKQRKMSTIDRISHTTCEGKMLSCTDKLVNIREMVNDFQFVGEKLWSRFNAVKSEQEWYYRSMCKVFSSEPMDISESVIYKQFKNYVDQLFS